MCPRLFVEQDRAAHVERNLGDLVRHIFIRGHEIASQNPQFLDGPARRKQHSPTIGQGAQADSFGYIVTMELVISHGGSPNLPMVTTTSTPVDLTRFR